MKFRIMHQQSSNNAQSPIRVIEQTSRQEVGWINRYLEILSFPGPAPCGWTAPGPSTYQRSLGS